MTPTDPRRAGFRESIQRRLQDAPRQYAALQQSMSAFGADFDRDAFAEAFESSDDLEAYTRVQSAEQGLTTLQNYVVELAGAGAELAGLRGPAQPNARRDLALLRDAGVISAAQCERLTATQATRNLVQHAYAELEPSDLHESIGAMHAELPAFLRAFTPWIEPHL